MSAARIERIIHDLVEHAADRSLALVALALVLGGLAIVVHAKCAPRSGVK